MKAWMLAHEQKFWMGRGTVVLEETLESSLDCKVIQPVHPKDQSWVFIGRIDAEAEIPILWPPDAKSWLIGKDPDAGRDWGQEEKGTTEDEMVGWHHWLDGHGFGWTLGVGDVQGGLVCCSPWGCRVGHDWVTELRVPKRCGGDAALKCIFSKNGLSSQTSGISIWVETEKK